MSFSKDNIASFDIDDELCNKTGLIGKFINDDKISITGFIPILPSRQDIPSDLAGMHSINIHQLKTNFILDEKIVRSLVTESSNVFLKLQINQKTASNTDFLQISRTYRSIIRACLERLQNVVEHDKDEDVEFYKNFITIFYSVECVWHLCEFLIIDESSSNAVVSNLLEWIRFHFPTHERLACELIQQGRDLDSNDVYWPVVKGLIMQGQITVAITLLRMHSSSESISFQVAYQILKNMPTYSIYGGLSLPKFRSQWQYWSTDAESKISAGILAAEPELEEIVKLCIGDQKTWFDQCKTSTCWYELFPGFLFYTEPGCKYFELGVFANNWLSQWVSSRKSGKNLKHLDKVILSVMENNMHELLHDIQNMCDNKWFVTHLTDLFYHSGQLHITDNNCEDQFRESLLFDYGAELMAKETLWQVGLDYLQYSNSEGLGIRDILLTRIATKHENQVMKVIFVARKYGLTHVETDICRVQVKKNLQRECYGNALEWSLRSKDTVYITGIANLFLENYANTGTMLCQDILSSIGAKIFLSPRLLFLVKYNEFHKCFEEKFLREAAELLISLMQSKNTPDFFWPVLLGETLPLLEYPQEVIFGTKETNIILHHIESDLLPVLKKEKAERELLKNSSSETTSKKLNLLKHSADELVELLRWACARNLSRAFIIENTMLPATQVDNFGNGERDEIDN